MDVRHADPDLAQGHSLLRQRAPVWERAAAAVGFPVQRIEVYRPDARQAWLYGQGRVAAELVARGLDPALAQPLLPQVTNAWSARTSAHGFTLPDGTPAAAAADYAVLGPDGLPWTADDPWAPFISWCLAHEQLYGLRHFGPPQRPPPDRPHLQLVEYSDVTHQLDRFA